MLQDMFDGQMSSVIILDTRRNVNLIGFWEHLSSVSRCENRIDAHTQFLHSITSAKSYDSRYSIINEVFEDELRAKTFLVQPPQSQLHP